MSPFEEGTISGILTVFIGDFKSCLPNRDENVTFFNKKAVL